MRAHFAPAAGYSGAKFLLILNFRACGLLAVQNPLMGALQFENFRACGGLLVVQNPIWELYHFKIFAPAALLAVQNPLMGSAI